MIQSGLKTLLVLLSFLIVCLPAYSQDSNARRLVLHVTVSDGKERAVRGLSQNDFSVALDKTPQSIVSFSDADVPSSVGILFDDSHSMRFGNKKNSTTWRARLVEGLGQFFKNTHPENEYFAVVFGNSAPGLSDWASDIPKMQELVTPVTDGGPTALYDVCDLAIRKLQTGRHQKHILLVLTDGQDSYSRFTFQQLRDELRDSDVALYPIVISSASDAGSSLVMEGEGVMSELAELSGGRIFKLPANSTPEIVSDLFTMLALEIKTQYQLVVNPQVVTEKKPKARKIKVSAVQTDASGKPRNLRTRTRQAITQ